jgi:hypothetical protein
VSSDAPASSQPHLRAALIDIEYQGSFSLLSFAPETDNKEPVSVMLPEAQVSPSWATGHSYYLQWAEADSHLLGPGLQPRRSPIAA